MLSCRRLRTQLAPQADANFDPPDAAMQRYKEKVSECLDSWTPMHKHRLLEASVVMRVYFEERRQLGLLERSVIHRAAVYIAVRALACRIDAPDLGKVHCRGPTGIPR